MTIINPVSKSFNWPYVFIILLSVAVLDYMTGYELGFFAFYFLPISFAAWRLGLFSALMTAIFSAMVWFWMVQFSHGLCPECAKRYLDEAGLANHTAQPR